MNKNKIITSLYDQYKNTNKKLKIICDWDEVIQSVHPYALWKTYTSIFKDIKYKEKKKGFLTDYKLEDKPFPEFFKKFWKGDEHLVLSFEMKYSAYGSSLKIEGTEIRRRYEKEASIFDFYQQAPFLTIAEDLLRLIKEDKIERLIFLSAYDKRKFPNGDPRKRKIFEETFFKFSKFVPSGKTGKGGGEMMAYSYSVDERNIWLELIPFDSENQGQTKADWIKENASDFDLVIDDNPNICKSLVENNGLNPCYTELCGKTDHHCEKCEIDITVISPYYPAIENQHHEEVVLVKNEVSDLKKEEFEHYGIK